MPVVEETTLLDLTDPSELGSLPWIARPGPLDHLAVKGLVKGCRPCHPSPPTTGELPLVSEAGPMYTGWDIGRAGM